VRIEAADPPGCEPLLRYCARPPFALERLRELDPARLLYESTKPGPGGNASLLLTPPQLLDRLAASAATAASACWRERPVIGDFRGEPERPELAGGRH
jgi:hypothetical protein